MKKIAIFMLGVFCLAACNESEEDVLIPSDALITIDPVITRATDTNFENGDKIGLTVTKEDGSAYASNTLMTFADGVFTGDLKWYAEGNDVSTLTAYYPYEEDGTPASFSVQTDQTETGYDASDLMGATKSDVLPSVNSVSMVFKHLLTKILINVENESGADISSIVLQGAVPTAKFDFAELTVEADDTKSAADITAQEVTANTIYRAIVIPQTVAFTLVVKTSEGETLSQSLVSTELAQSGQYNVDVRVLPGDITVKISGEIENWTDEGKIGLASDEPDFEEFSDYFVYDGDRYDIVTLANGSTWMKTALRYLPKGLMPTTDPLDDNSHIWYPYKLENGEAIAVTDEATIATNGYFYDAYAAFGGKVVTTENCYDFEGAQGICPPGWHIPTRAEYFDLVGNSNKDAFDEVGQQYKDDALFYDSGYLAGKIGLANDGGFNYVMSGVRMKSNATTAVGAYQKTVTSTSNCSVEEWLGLPSVSYYMSSTCFKPYFGTNGNTYTYTQFFTLMSTFTTQYKEGKLSLAYAHIETGQSIRCIKD